MVALILNYEFRMLSYPTKLPSGQHIWLARNPPCSTRNQFECIAVVFGRLDPRLLMAPSPYFVERPTKKTGKRSVLCSLCFLPWLSDGFSMLDMGVSWNRGTPKWMIYKGNPVKMDDFAVPPFMETPIYPFGCRIWLRQSDANASPTKSLLCGAHRFLRRPAKPLEMLAMSV